jgi:hypothetical protein
VKEASHKTAVEALGKMKKWPAVRELRLWNKDLKQKKFKKRKNHIDLNYNSATSRDFYKII